LEQPRTDEEQVTDVNKILASLCALGLAACVGIVIYIRRAPEPSSQPRPLPASQEAKPAATRVDGRTVATGFYNPCGVAVQPQTGHIFISMVDRIVRVVPGEPYQVHDEITGFSRDNYGRGPTFEFGPLGLAFADPGTLIVGDGSQRDGEEIVRIYKVGSVPLPRDKVRKAGDMLSYSTSIAPGDQSLQGEGNFYGVAIHGSHVFVTSNGDDTKGWICKLELDLKRPPPLTLTPFIASKELTDTDAPMGATISPDGKLVVSQFGQTNIYPDSLLTFYDPATGHLEKKLKTGLRDVLGIAYSPRTGNLYALDFSWAAPKEGGLFRLEVSSELVVPVRLATLERPTALAFAPNGTLYVSVMGSGAAEGKSTGQLLLFEGL
jgi:DNA-binding beta-propeller fold protein YncE